MTTSPSYPLLASIEANIEYLDSRDGRKEIDNLSWGELSSDIAGLNVDTTLGNLVLGILLKLVVEETSFLILKRW